MPYTIAWCSLTQKHNCTLQQHNPQCLWSVRLLELYFPASLLFMPGIVICSYSSKHITLVSCCSPFWPAGCSSWGHTNHCAGHLCGSCVGSTNKELLLFVGFSWLWLATVSLLAHGSVSCGVRGPRVWLDLGFRSKGEGQREGTQLDTELEQTEPSKPTEVSLTTGHTVWR